MMMMGDHKKLMATVVGKLKGDSPGEAEPAYDDSIAKKAAAKKLIEAVKAGDEGSVIGAFEDMLSLLDSGEEPEAGEAVE